MKPWLDDGDVQFYHGDALDVLRTLPAGIAQTCVTSPPYWGLRDYGTGTWTGGDADCDHRAPAERRQLPHGDGRQNDSYADERHLIPGAGAVYKDACGKCGATRTDDQLGLEATPAEYVENMVNLFREVRRVLRDDGTLWLNLGDSFYSNTATQGRNDAERRNQPGVFTDGVVKPRQSSGGDPATWRGKTFRREVAGLKPKDLVGIPWMVARAMQAPYYTGTIRNELDRVWLAAMIDAEGCMFVHCRKVGQSNGQGYVRKNATYGSGLEIANCHESIVRRCMEITGRGSISVQTEGRKQPLYRWNLRTNECREVIREVYPYLVGKQHQARVAYGCPASGERAEAAHAALKLLHNGGLTDVDFPAPPSCLEPGWYLRSDVIWSKSNPMPESVTDRPTKSHEYLFLFSKQPRYYFDADAIREPHATPIHAPGNRDKRYDPAGASNGHHWNADRMDESWGNPAGRNRRSVWTIPTEPFPEAHFATYPQLLVVPCILAGTSERGECVECGAPWRRVVEETAEYAAWKARENGWAKRSGDLEQGRGTAGSGSNSATVPTKQQTTGWEPSCACIEQAIHDDPTPAQLVGRGQPQLVLDPFIGSGTTALVARKHGRRCIGIDLSTEYLAIAAKRTQQLSLLGTES